MLLTDKPDARVERPATRRIDAAEIGSWGWPQSSYDSGKRVLLLEQLPDERDVGEHDVLLDWERTLRPYRQLVVEANELPPQSSILAVAEVDDRRRASSYVVVEVSARGATSEPQPGGLVLFRSPSPKRGGDGWPTFRVASPRGAGPIELDGPALLKGTGYRFIRWSHVRFVGPSSVTSITLADPYGTLKIGGER
jgi:hypothetical protein